MKYWILFATLLFIIVHGSAEIARTERETRSCTFDGYSVNVDGNKFGVGVCTNLGDTNNGLNFEDAIYECKKQLGQLAIIHDATDQEQIVELLKPHKESYAYEGCELCGVWIGLEKIDGNYKKWIDGSEVTYTKWHSGEPNGVLEKTVGIRFHEGNWNDYVPDTNVIKGYVCEQPKETPLCYFDDFTVTAGNNKYGIGECSQPISWADAVIECKKSVGHLATIKSSAVNEAIRTLFGTYKEITCPLCGAWIGMERGFTTYTKWIDGSDVSFTNWENQEPSNAHAGDSAVGMFFLNGKWNNFPSLTHIKTFVCEQPLNERVCHFKGYNTNSGGKHYGIGDCSKTIPWEDAVRECENEFGQLATIHSAAENDIIQNLYGRNLFGKYRKKRPPLGSGTWVGMHQDYTTLQKWIDFSNVSYTNWKPNDYDAYASSKSVELFYTNGQWDDVGPNAFINTYSCEQKTDAPLSCHFAGFSVEADGKKYGIGECSKPLSWADAVTECAEAFGTLATVHSAVANEKITTMFKEYKDPTCPVCGAWIGMEKTITTDKKWFGGSDVTYKNWECDDCVSGIMGENAVAMMFITGKWNYYQSLTHIKTYVCERPSDDRRTCHFKGFKVNVSDTYYGIGGCSQTISWDDAKKECEKSFGHLATIQSSAVNSIIKTLFGGYRDPLCLKCDTWIGLKRTGTAYTKWIDGSNVNYTFWADNEPSSNTNENKVGMLFLNGRWKDHASSPNDIKTFVCEQKHGDARSCKYDGFSVTADNKRYGIGECSKAIPWAYAANECKSYFGQLATVHSAEANEKITGILNKYINLSCPLCGAWIGMDQFFTTYQKWIDGTNVDYKNWETFEPDSSGATTAVGMLYLSGKWNDYLKTANIKTFLCEQPIDGPRVCKFNGFAATFSGYKYGVGQCTKRIDFDSAQRECRKFFGQLVIIKNAEINQKIKTLLEPYENSNVESKQVWIGLRVDHKVVTNWEDGSPVTYTNWFDEQPDDLQGLETAVTIRMPNLEWNDIEPDENIQLYVCQKAENPPLTCSLDGYTVNADGNKYGIGKCSKRISWANAFDECIKWVGQLATIDNAAANEKIRSLFTPFWDPTCLSCGAWIGMNGHFTSYKKWTDGSDATYTNWKTSEPSNSLRTRSVGMTFVSGKWDEYDINTETINTFLCEQPKDSRICNFTGYPEKVNSVEYGIGYCSEYISWSDAVKECKKRFGKLATIHSSAAQSKIQTLFNTYRLLYDNLEEYNRIAWIGMERTKNTYMKWIDGSRADYINWNDPNKPNSNHESVVAMSIKTGKWEKIDPMVDYVKHFVCEHDQDAPRSCNFNGYTVSIDNKKYGIGVCDQEITWSDAVHECKQSFGNLATIHSATTNKDIAALIQPYLNPHPSCALCGAWIGMERIAKSFNKWIDGSNVSYTNWAPGEPNDYRGTEDFIAMLFANGKWNDYPLSNVRIKNFVCEQETDAPRLCNFNGFTVTSDNHKYGIGDCSKPLAWKDAEIECRVSAGRMATMGKPLTNDVITTLAAPYRPYQVAACSYCGAWIGMKRSSPTKSGHDMALTMFFGDGSWNGYSAINQIKSFVCEQTEDPSPQCGGNPTALNATFQSPNYQTEPGGRRQCDWIINPGGWGRIKLQFTTHILEQSTNCNDGYVEVRDGLSSSSTIIKKFCGTSNPGDIYSMDTKMHIRFVSKSSSNSTRIKALYIRQLYVNGCPLTTGGSGVCANECTSDSECATGKKCCPSNCGGYKCTTATSDTYK